MDFLKIAGKDIKNIFKNRIIRVSVIAIIIVPLLYSLLYLKASWDPYGDLTSMPVAVVNLDNGAKLDDKDVNYGKDMVDELKDNKDVGWKVTNEAEADSGLSGKKYYAKFVIPKDFSEKIISAKNGKPVAANIEFVSNEKKNYLASKINSSVETKLKEKITATITKNYVGTSFDKLYDVKDGLVTASDGSKKLYDGVGQLNEKTPMLADGVKALESGSGDLYSGQEQLNSAINKVSGGLKEVNDKAPALSSGVDKLYTGSSELKNGLNSASSGSNQLADGSQKLYNSFSGVIYPSVNQLKQGANKLNSALGATDGKVPDISGASNALNNGSDKISKSSNDIQDGYGQVKSGVDTLINGVNASNSVMNSVASDLQKAMESGDKNDIASALKKLQAFNEANKDTPEKIKELKQGTEKLNSGLKEYNSGVQSYTDNVKKYATATGSFAGNISELSKGVNQLSNGLDSLEKGLNENNPGSFGNGLKSVSDNMSTLNSGISKLDSGSSQINGGLSELKGSIPALTSGISTLYDGSVKIGQGSNELLSGETKLNSGVKELGNKVPDLTSGVTKLYDGSKELSEKLGDGAKEIKSGLVNSSSTMGDFVSKPVTIENKPINPVANYGTGLAPYFMPLSLWIGGVMMFFVISLKPDNSIKTSKFNKVFGKFLSFGFVGVLQAILLAGVVLMIGLKPTNIPLYFGLLIFLSLVFLSIVYCLISLLGDPGRLLCIVLLLLQLTTCAGTFPIELVPNFFKSVSPYLPFTYAVEALREVISATTINYSVIGKDMLVLGIIAVVFIIISVVFRSVGDRLQDAIEEKRSEIDRINASTK